MQASQTPSSRRPGGTTSATPPGYRNTTEGGVAPQLGQTNPPRIPSATTALNGNAHRLTHRSNNGAFTRVPEVDYQAPPPPYSLGPQSEAHQQGLVPPRGQPNIDQDNEQQTRGGKIYERLTNGWDIFKACSSPYITVKNAFIFLWMVIAAWFLWQFWNYLNRPADRAPGITHY